MILKQIKVKGLTLSLEIHETSFSLLQFTEQTHVVIKNASSSTIFTTNRHTKT